MTSNDPAARTPPQAVSSEPTAEPAVSSGGAVGFLLGHDLDPQREIRRITIALATLAAVALVVINLWIYRNNRIRVERQGWRQLIAETEEKRDQAEAVLNRFRESAAYVVGQPVLQVWARETMNGAGGANEAVVLGELQRAQVAFGFRSIALLRPDGSVAMTTRPGEPEDPAAAARTAAQASRSRTLVIGTIDPDHADHQNLGVAVPIAPPGAEGEVPVALVEVDLDELLTPVLSSWPGVGASAGGYVVRQEGGWILVLSTPRHGIGLEPGERIAATDPRVRIAGMAAAGVESAVDGRDRRGNAIMAVTRRLPALGWGLVAHADRDDMLRGSRAARWR